MSLNMVYTNHMNDIQTYLSGKLPEVPSHIVQEIAAHISNRTAILVSDMMREYDREIRYKARMSESRMKEFKERLKKAEEGGCR